MIDWVKSLFDPAWLIDLGVTVDQVTAGANAIIQVGAVLVLVVFVTGLLKVGRGLGKATLVQAAGVVLAAIGWFNHRGYWNISIFERYDQSPYAVWAADYRLFPASQTLLIMLGTLMALTRFGILYLGRTQWWTLVVFSYTAWVGYSVYLAS